MPELTNFSIKVSRTDSARALFNLIALQPLIPSPYSKHRQDMQGMSPSEGSQGMLSLNGVYNAECPPDKTRQLGWVYVIRWDSGSIRPMMVLLCKIVYLI